MKKTKALGVAFIAIIMILPLQLMPKVCASDILTFDFRYSNYGFFTMTTYVYKLASIGGKDLYGIKVTVSASTLVTMCNCMSFGISTNGIAVIMEPHTEFEGGFNPTVGSGGDISISVPYGACYSYGIGTNQTSINSASLTWSSGSDCYTEWEVNTGETFQWTVSSTCSLTIPIPFMSTTIWSDTAVWAPSTLVRPPTPSLMTNEFVTTTTTTFNASESLGGFDGDEVVPITAYQWDFGDGTAIINTTNPVVQHTYPVKIQFYRVTLTVYAPGLGYVSPNYIPNSTTMATIEIAPQDIKIDAFVSIESYNTDGSLASKTISGVGIGRSYNGHASTKYNDTIARPCALVNINGTPVSGQWVAFSMIDTGGYLHGLGTGLTDEYGIATGYPMPLWPRVFQGIYTNIAVIDDGPYRGLTDWDSFCSGGCALVTGYTLDGYIGYIESIRNATEGCVVNITATCPGSKFDYWISYSFVGKSFDNPVQIQMNNDCTVIAKLDWLVDIDGNGKIDISDVATVARAFGSSPGKPFWNPRADIDGNGKIDISDVALVARSFSRTTPLFTTSFFIFPER